MTESVAPLAGRHALVTGASRGLGEAIATRLASDGARVALVGRVLADLERVADAIRADGGAADVLSVDVTDREAKAASEATAQQRGLGQIFETYGGRTGTILIVGPGGSEPVAVLIGETDVAAYDEPIAEARSS